MFRLFKFLFSAFILLNLLVALPANAADETLQFDKVSKQLTAIEKKLKSGNFTVQGIDEDANFLYQTSGGLSAFKREYEREAAYVQKQIDALGSAPEDGSKELKVIAQKRTEFNNTLAIIKSKIAEVQILEVKIEELNLLILNSRNQKILGNLVAKQDILLNPQNFFASVKAFAGFCWDIVTSPINWYKMLDASGKNYILTYFIPILFILIGAFGAGLILRRLILRNWGYRTDIENPRYGQKLFAAVAVAVAYGVIPTLIIGGFLIWMIGMQIFTTGFFGITINSTLYYLLYIIMARAIARVIFAPYHEKWRLINLGTAKATGIVKALYLSIWMIGIVSLLEYIARAANYQTELINFIVAADCAVKSFVIILLVSRIFYEEEPEQSAESDAADEADDSMSTSFKIIFISSFISIATFGIALFGYPDLSAFIFNRYILSALLLVLFIICHRLFAEIIKHVLLLGFWAKTFKMRRKILTKINFGLSLVLTPLLAMCFIFVFLNLWGLSGDLILHVVKKILFGFSIGGVRISLIAIILGIIVFFGSLAVMKTLKNNLTNNVFAKLDIDEGIKHSLSSGVSFVGFVIASLLAIIVMGGNLTSLAVIAGALSVGIGFGLQNIFNNFVSGIIILFERPVKVGDWVVFNGEEGQIKQINIRSTELETFKKTSVIIPNATLISSALINLTHGNNWTRQAVSVGVAYGTDVNKVTDILLECARNNKKVLKTPAPYVIFKDFGSSSLDFELRCYSSNIWVGWNIPSELRYEINRRFMEEGIEIPFQQIVIHQGDTSVSSETQFYGNKK